MAIIGPKDLPVVLHVDSNPLKMHVLSQLGHPTVLVEISESAIEQVLRSTGDFISTYYALEEKYAFMMTTPLQGEYPVPEDAYWIRSVAWDPSVTRLDEIFSAESFLFSFCGGSILLTEGGPLSCEECYEKRSRLVTPFGHRRSIMRWNAKHQPMTLLKTEKDFLACTPNHPVNCNGKFRSAELCNIGDKLINHKDRLCEIIDKQQLSTEGTWSIQNKTGSLYVSALGKEFYLAH